MWNKVDLQYNAELVKDWPKNILNLQYNAEMVKDWPDKSTKFTI